MPNLEDTVERFSDDNFDVTADIVALVRAAWNLCDGTANENPPEVDQDDWDTLSAALYKLDRLPAPKGVIAGPGAKVEYFLLTQAAAGDGFTDDAVDRALDRFMMPTQEGSSSDWRIGRDPREIDDFRADMRAALVAVVNDTVAHIPRYRFYSGDYADSGSMIEGNDGSWINLSDLTAALSQQETKEP